MINVKELRIGNKIYPRPDCNEVVEVTDMDDFGRIGTTAFFYNKKGTADTNTESACGIPLTPEWLGRCGFELEAIPDSVDDEGDIIKGYTHWTNGKCCFHFEDGKLDPWAHINAVHLFQNWYYFNHNEELQTKLP